MEEKNILEQQENSPCAQAEPSEAEKIARLESDYADLQKKYALLQQRSAVEKICFESGCADPDYLEYSAVKRGIDLCDNEALRTFAEEFSKIAPGCFHARITPGSSACNAVKHDSSANHAEETRTADRIGLIALSIDNAPDAVSR